MIRVKVWDGFIRGYHWLQAGLIFGLWYCADNGDMDWHFVFGYALCALWLSRFIWGLFGSDTAKFGYFIKSPLALIAYLRDADKFKRIKFGHNPAGGYMVVVMLTLLLVQLITGLTSSDDILSEGPLAQYFSSDTVNFMTWLHKFNFDLICAAVVVHLTAIVVYKLKRQNLLQAMITGHAEYPKLAYGTHAARETTTNVGSSRTDVGLSGIHAESAFAQPKLIRGVFGWLLFTALAILVWWLWGHDSLGYLLY